MSRLSGMTGSITWDPSATSANATSTNTITVPGAKQGDYCFVSFDNVDNTAAGNVILGAIVTGDDTVTVQIHADGDGQNVANSVIRVKVVPFENL